LNRKFGRSIILSEMPLRGWYRYKNEFQIIPISSEAPKPPPFISSHYPLILEYSYEPEVWPNRKSIFWHRDLWEHERYEYMMKKVRLSENKTWKNADLEIKKDLRPTAIEEEICILLSVMSKFTFFKYKSKKYWSSSFESDKNSDSVWGWIRYKYKNFNNQINCFTKPSSDKIDVFPHKKYYRRFRDATYSDREENKISLPDFMDEILTIYFSLENSKKRAFFESCFLYYKSLEIREISKSMALISAVSAIEALANLNMKDKKCKNGKTKRFKKFILIVDSKDEQDNFFRESLELIQIVLINWLIKQKSP